MSTHQNEPPGPTFLESMTFSIKELYNQIAPNIFPPPQYPIKRPLNPVEEMDEYSQGSFEGHRIVCINEIFEDTYHNQFRVIGILGNGTFSYVFKCQLVSNPNHFVALKIIKNLEQYRATGIAEIRIHQMMNQAPDHPGKNHIICPLSTFEQDRHVCMVLPLLYRSLFEGISCSQSLIGHLGTIRLIMEQVFQALDFIHLNGIIHCDLKPDNILFSNEDFQTIKIIDFGSAMTGQGEIGQYIQSRFYRSPEVILGLPFNEKIDIWSAGCIAVELYLDFAIFACESDIDCIHSMLVLLGPIPAQILQVSQFWRKFFDLNPSGYVPKMNPVDVLLTRNSYCSIYQEIGALPLDQLIMNHNPIQSEEELKLVRSFSHFVHCLLNYDVNSRLSAFQALHHPFLTGETLENWAPPPDRQNP